MVIGRFPGVSNLNAGAAFNPPFGTSFRSLDSWLNANACLAGEMAEVESGFFGVTCRIALFVAEMFSESRIRGADSPFFLDGDGVTGSFGGKNRGGAETRAWATGFFGVIVLSPKARGRNAFSKTAGRGWGRLGVADANPSGPNSRGRLDGG